MHQNCRTQPFQFFPCDAEKHNVWKADPKVSFEILAILARNNRKTIWRKNTSKLQIFLIKFKWDIFDDFQTLWYTDLNQQFFIIFLENFWVKLFLRSFHQVCPFVFALGTLFPKKMMMVAKMETSWKTQSFAKLEVGNYFLHTYVKKCLHVY